jgi:TatA/E family protein of Tat protein translocase
MIGFQEMAIIGIVAILLFGAPKIIQWAKALGEAKREFKKVEREFKETSSIEDRPVTQRVVEREYVKETPVEYTEVANLKKNHN